MDEQEQKVIVGWYAHNLQKAIGDTVLHLGSQGEDIDALGAPQHIDSFFKAVVALQEYMLAAEQKSGVDGNYMLNALVHIGAHAALSANKIISEMLAYREQKEEEEKKREEEENDRWIWESD